MFNGTISTRILIFYQSNLKKDPTKNKLIILKKCFHSVPLENLEKKNKKLVDRPRILYE